jgi:hypothetical protein
MSTVAGTPRPANQQAAALSQPTDQPSLQSGSLRAAWVALFLIFGILVGTAAGALAIASGLNVLRNDRRVGRAL